MAEPGVVLAAARAAVELAQPERVLAEPAAVALAAELLAATQVSRTRSWCACRSRILRMRPRLRAPVTLEAAAEPAGLARAARHVRAGPMEAVAEPVERAGLARALVDPAEVLAGPVVLVDRLRSNLLS